MENGTSLAELATSLEAYRPQILQGLVALPLGGALLGRVLVAVQERAGAWFLSAVVHVAVFLMIPPALVLGYLVLGTHTNLFTDVDALLYIAPILAGMATLFVVPQVMPFHRIPGFDRLRGLFGLAFLTTLIVWFLSRMHFVTYFWVRGGVGSLLMAGFVVFVLLKVCLDKVFRPARVHDLELLDV